MTQEEKELLRKDLCARLPYGVKVLAISVYGLTVQVPIDGYCSSNNKFDIDLRWRTLDEFKPYLRPMSSMTEEESEYCKEQFGITSILTIEGQRVTIMPMEASSMFIDWLNAHHFDYRGLIEKGLALEAPKDIYD